jgi:hypothetical protein
MSAINITKNDNVQLIGQDQMDHPSGITHEPSTNSEEQGQHPVSALMNSRGTESAELSFNLSENKANNSPGKPTKVKVLIEVSTDNIGMASSSPTLIGTQVPSSCDIVGEILDCVAKVERQMNIFRHYIESQNDENKPLHQWKKYGGYAALSTTVCELEEAVTTLKNGRLLPAHLTASVAQATSSSTSVSKTTAYAFAMMNSKMANYMKDMETSRMSDEATAKANVVIMEELQKLMKHSFRAAGQVWLATDVLRSFEQRHTQYKDWAWFVTATVVTAVIAATVSIVTVHLYGLAGFNMVPKSNSEGIYTQLVDLVQRTQALTNPTSELYTIKLQDIDRRYDDLAALAESHGLRIDNLVEALGPPNDEGTYYLPMPKTDSRSYKDLQSLIQKVSDETKRQQQRYQVEMKLMRKNMHRMDIRFTSAINKKRKD